jgi:hypothetical protein
VIVCFHPVVNGLCSALLKKFNLAGAVGTTLEDMLVVLHNNARAARSAERTRLDRQILALHNVAAGICCDVTIEPMRYSG